METFESYKGLSVEKLLLEYGPPQSTKELSIEEMLKKKEAKAKEGMLSDEEMKKMFSMIQSQRQHANEEADRVDEQMTNWPLMVQLAYAFLNQEVRPHRARTGRAEPERSCQQMARPARPLRQEARAESPLSPAGTQQRPAAELPLRCTTPDGRWSCARSICCARGTATRRAASPSRSSAITCASSS